MHPASQIRSARAVAVLVTLGLAASLLSLSLMAVSASSQSPGEGFLWVLSIEGGSVKTTIQDNGAPDPEDLFKSTSIATQKGKIDFYFMVNPDGSITPVGTPNGHYTELTWHLEGVNGEPEFDEEGNRSGGEFDCDPPVTGADFNPGVSGTATDTRMILTVDLPDAYEKNDEEDCGGGFPALATTSQYLQESLLFCKDQAGPITLPYAATYTASCIKSEPSSGQYSVQGDTRRKTEHSWKLELTRTNGPPPTSSPSPTATTSPTPGVTPSSSPTAPGGEPSPSPTPTATPSTHSRVSLLVLRKHLNAYGAVALAGWGAPECVDAVNVRIQRRLGRSSTGFWNTEKTVITNSIGVWSTKLKDAPGRYRALAPEVKKDQATCKKAVSKGKTHNHR